MFELAEHLLKMQLVYCALVIQVFLHTQKHLVKQESSIFPGDRYKKLLWLD